MINNAQSANWIKWVIVYSNSTPKRKKVFYKAEDKPWSLFGRSKEEKIIFLKKILYARRFFDLYVFF